MGRQQEPRCCQQQRSNERVCGIVKDGAGAWSAKVTEKAQVGDKKQREKKPPGQTHLPMEQNGEHQDCGALRA